MKRTSQKLSIIEEESYQLDSRIDQALQNLKTNISSEQETSIERSIQVENMWDLAMIDEDEWE